MAYAYYSQPRYRGHRYIIDKDNGDALVDMNDPPDHTYGPNWNTQEEYWPECDSRRKQNHYGYSMFGSLDKRYAGYI